MSNKRLQTNPLAHLVSEAPKKDRTKEAKQASPSSINDMASTVVQSERAGEDDFKRHTFFIRKDHIRMLKKMAYEQDRSIKDILDDVLVLGLKHL